VDLLNDLWTNNGTCLGLGTTNFMWNRRHRKVENLQVATHCPSSFLCLGLDISSELPIHSMIFCGVLVVSFIINTSRLATVNQSYSKLGLTWLLWLLPRALSLCIIARMVQSLMDQLLCAGEAICIICLFARVLVTLVVIVCFHLGASPPGSKFVCIAG
jgi:hypothetical protein